MKKGGRVFYGWFIVAACFLIMSVSIGILNNATGVYVKPVCEDMGFSRQQMALNIRWLRPVRWRWPCVPAGSMAGLT